MLGAIFTILSAATFSLQGAAVRRGVLTTAASNAIYVSVILGVPLFVAAAAISGQLFHASDLSGKAYLLLMAAGPLHFLVGRYGYYRAVKAMGSNRSAPVQAMSIPYSVLMAVVLLDEKVTLLMAVGITLVMIGPAIMLHRSSGERAGAEKAGQQGPDSLPDSGERAPGATPIAATRPQEGIVPPPPLLLEGYIFGTLGAVAWGTTPLIVREAIGGTGLGILGGLISYSAATAVLLLSLALPGRRAVLRQMDRTALRWFLMGTNMVFLAQVFRYSALDLVGVTVVAPLLRTGAVFTLLFAFLINRRFESFGPSTLAGIFISVLGSVLLVV